MATTNDLINPAKSLVGTTDAVITFPQSAFWNYQTTNDGTPLNTITALHLKQLTIRVTLVIRFFPQIITLFLIVTKSQRHVRRYHILEI